MANPQNVAGHQARLDYLKQTVPAEEVGLAYIGGRGRGDPAVTGFLEEEVIRRHHALDDAFVVDLGCGVGRLTRYMIEAPLRGYLGTDILPEILDEARAIADGRANFHFAIARDCEVPLASEEADIVAAFSLITHLLDEEVFIYFRETARVLKPGGVATFSFLDYAHPEHFQKFHRYVSSYRKSERDLLKCFEKSTLSLFASTVGLEVIEIIDRGTRFPASGRRHQLVTGANAPAQGISFGQSLIFLRKPWIRSEVPGAAGGVENARTETCAD
jgi:SAM-dependent methyltransferase